MLSSSLCCSRWPLRLCPWQGRRKPLGLSLPGTRTVRRKVAPDSSAGGVAVSSQAAEAAAEAPPICVFRMPLCWGSSAYALPAHGGHARETMTQVMHKGRLPERRSCRALKDGRRTATRGPAYSVTAVLGDSGVSALCLGVRRSQTPLWMHACVMVPERLRTH